MDMVSRLIDLTRGRRTAVLAGAGCSTESGIPDYRGPEGRLRSRSPLQYGDFVRSEEARQRYWARSTVGWRRMSDARPNPAHAALADLERWGRVAGVITQNVDGLHHAAGSHSVIELHGSLAFVVCLGCRRRSPREALQRRLVSDNEGWLSRSPAAQPRVAPDGDAELPPEAHRTFRVPGCRDCGGILKPDVVFFGESVPRERVEAGWRLLDEADVLLVVGSSLAVYSGRRFVYGAVERQVPIGVVNLGPTRADDLATARVEGSVGEILPKVVEGLTGL